MNALDQSRILLLILSKHSNRSPHVRREVLHAATEKIKILPVRIDKVNPNANIKFIIEEIHRLDLFQGLLEDHFPKLVSDIKKMLKQNTLKS